MVFITDRTESDALLRNGKGVYGYTDLNRVEQAVTDIAAEFDSLGIGLQLIIKTDWGLPGDFSVSEWPVESQMKRYLSNVAAIRDRFLVAVQLPDSMNKLNWKSANNIEKVLQTAFARIDSIRQCYRYSGEIFAGEE